MTGNRWWHTLFAVTMAVLIAIALVNLLDGDTRQYVALVALALLILSYVTFGWRGFRSAPVGIAFAVVLIVLSGLAVAASPNMALVQCIAMPLLWIQIPRRRDALVANVALTAAIAVGMGFALRIDGVQDVTQVVLVEGISLGGSIALGLWIGRLADLLHERERLLTELREAQGQVAALNHEAGVTSERERLAREIHDTIAQSLTGLVMLGQRAQREVRGVSDGAADSASVVALEETLSLVEETAREALVETRALVAAVAPVELGAGIASALERLGRRFERETGVVVSVTADVGGSLGEPGTVRDIEVVLLRCAQEGLANIRKHADAAHADLVLRRIGGDLVLTVHDDGAGFDFLHSSDGFGLVGMRARLGLVAGRLDLRSAPGHGTTLVASLPLPAAVVGFAASASASASAPVPAPAPAPASAAAAAPTATAPAAAPPAAAPPAAAPTVAAPAPSAGRAPVPAAAPPAPSTSPGPAAPLPPAAKVPR